MKQEQCMACERLGAVFQVQDSQSLMAFTFSEWRREGKILRPEDVAVTRIPCRSKLLDDALTSC